MKVKGQLTQLCTTLCNPVDPLKLLCPWNFPGKNTGVGNHFLCQEDLPDPGIESTSPALQADSLPSEPPGKPLYINIIH